MGRPNGIQTWAIVTGALFVSLLISKGADQLACHASIEPKEEEHRNRLAKIGDLLDQIEQRMAETMEGWSSHSVMRETAQSPVAVERIETALRDTAATLSRESAQEARIQSEIVYEPPPAPIESDPPMASASDDGSCTEERLLRLPDGSERFGNL